MSQPARRVSTNLLHIHSLSKDYIHLCTHTQIHTHKVAHKHKNSRHTHMHTHFLSLPVTINVILSLLTFGGFSPLPLSVSLYPHSSLPHLQHLIVFLAALSPVLSFFTSLSWPILHLFLSLPSPRSLSLLSHLVSTLPLFGPVRPLLSSRVFLCILLKIMGSVSLMFVFSSSSHLFTYIVSSPSLVEQLLRGIQ